MSVYIKDFDFSTACGRDVFKLGHTWFMITPIGQTLWLSSEVLKHHWHRSLANTLFLFGLETVGGVMTVRRYAHLVICADSMELVTGAATLAEKVSPSPHRCPWIKSSLSPASKVPDAAGIM